MNTKYFLSLCVVMTATADAAQSEAPALPAGEVRDQKTDAYGDPLPPGAIMRIGTLRFWAENPVSSISFAPHGGELATVSAGYSDSVTIWDVRTGKIIRSLPTSLGSIPDEFILNEVEFAPDGKSLAASCSDGVIRIWESRTGRTIRELRGHQEGGISGIAFAPDGKTLASYGGDESLRIWDVNTGKDTRTVATSGLVGANSLALAPDRSSLAVSFKDETVRIWDLASGTLRQRLLGRLLDPNAFSSDCKGLTSLSPDGDLMSWNVATGKEDRRIPLESWCPDGITAISPDHKKIAAGCRDASIRIWDALTGRALRRIRLAPRNLATVISFAPDGNTIALASDDDPVFQLWDITSGQQRIAQPRHGGGVRCIALAHDGKMVASADEAGTLRLWDVATGEQIRRLYQAPHRLWEARNGDELRRVLRERIGGEGSLAFLPDRHTVAALTEDGTLYSWNTATGREVRRIHLDGSGPVGVAAFSPEANLIATTCEDRDSLGLWDAETGNLIRRTKTNHEGAVRALAYAIDGKRIATSSDDGVVKLWETATLSLLKPISVSMESIQCLAFSPDRVTIALGGVDGVLRLWSPDEGTIQRLPEGDDTAGSIWCVAFSADGHQVAWGGEDKSLRIWGLKGGRAIRQYHGHRSGISQVRFGADPRFVYSASGDGTVLLWNVPQGE